MSWFDMWQELGDYFTQKTSYETRIRPSNVDTERFHLSISPMPQPKIKENGAIQFFAKLEARAKMPASEQSIHDAMECFISLSELFSTTRGGVLSSMAGILSSIELDKDNEAFAESKRSNVNQR